MGYVQEFSIMGAVGPCRMFILSKRSQLRTTRNYSVFNVGKSCWRKKRDSQTGSHTHAHTHEANTSGQWEWSALNVSSDTLRTTSYHYSCPLRCFIKPTTIHLVTMVRTERTFTLFTSDLCQFLGHIHTDFWHTRTEVNRSGVSSQGALWRRRFHFIRLTTFLIWSDLHNKGSQTHSRGGL